MTLTVTAQTSIKDLVIDFIEVKFANGDKVSLTWDESEISRTDDGFEAWYGGIQTETGYVVGSPNIFRSIKITAVQVYTAGEGKEFLDNSDLIISHMEFYDDEGRESLKLFAPLYSGSTFELQRDDIEIDDYMEVDYAGSFSVINAELATLFNVDKKFGLCIGDEPETWLNMYAMYNPYDDTLHIECVISANEYCREFEYEPTENESKLIKDLITKEIKKIYHQTPQEFCEVEIASE